MSSNIESLNVLQNKYIIENRSYYEKKDCRFVLCEYCFWFATILKNKNNRDICPICKKMKILKNIIF